MKIKSTLGFFREFHRMPKRQKLAWCVFPTDPDDARTFNLGVMLVGTDKFINVATCRFEQLKADEALNPILAKRMAEGDYYAYKTASGSVLRLPKSYVADMYRTSVYSRGLLECCIL